MLQTGLLFLALAVLAACRGPLLPPTAGETAAAPPAASATARPVAASPTLPAAGEPSLTPTAGPVTPVVHGVLTTPTPTYPPRPTMPTATPTAAASPTPAQPWAVVAVQAHCRYGPGVAYLHAADLYPGDRGVIDGRNPSGTWLWILLDGLERHCWAATSTLTVNGAIDSVNVVESRLPYSDLYGPPQNVQTARDGSEVTIAWDPIPFTVDDDRGYMLELRLCQNGALSTQTFQTYDSILTVTDELDCNGFSGGTLWGVEKHGYTQPVEIPWP
jgi:hypothetical protein